MRYSKPPKTYEQQAELLIDRGLIAERDSLVSLLKRVSYYRLSGYLYPFRKDDENLADDTSLETIVRIYEYDRNLRILMLEAIADIEIALRTTIIYELVSISGPFGYIDKNNLPALSVEKHQEVLETIKKEMDRSNEVFMNHFKNVYGDIHPLPPLWMVAEIITFGTVVTIFRGLPNKLKQRIAGLYGVPDKVFQSWIIGINGVRNVCAHHSRFFNRRLGYRVFIPRKNRYPEWHVPVRIPNGTSFTVLTVANYFLNRFDVKNDWAQRVERLFDENSDIPLIQNSFPRKWKQSKLWSDVWKG